MRYTSHLALCPSWVYVSVFTKFQGKTASNDVGFEVSEICGISFHQRRHGHVAVFQGTSYVVQGVVW